MVLETPLSGRFMRERYLVFAPPNRYLGLVGACFFGGLILIVTGISAGAYWMFVGTMVTVAGVWGALSLNWLAFDLRDRTYARRDGAASSTRYAKGSLDELEALFVLAEDRTSFGKLMTRERAVTYRIVLQWKGMRLPSVILEQDYRAVPANMPLVNGAATSLMAAERYGRALSIPVVNHAHVSVSNPIPTAGAPF
jgi:hypothetical protein